MTTRTRSALESFAADDTLCHLVGQQMSSPTVRTWVHNQTVVLGIQDHRLPHVTEAVSTLENAGYNAIVRNSGGLAVVLDEGVLNISIVLSEHRLVNRYSGRLRSNARIRSYAFSGSR